MTATGRGGAAASFAREVAADLGALRARRPLILNITNYVVMNTTANALLALGASPVMAHAVDEIEEMVQLADALVLNLGTLSPPWIESMRVAGREAKRKGIPIVLDPVGAGATRLRTTTALSLLEEVGATVLRGNASEIHALTCADARTRGVDSSEAPESVLDDARALVERFGCVVSVSGEVDVIVSRDVVIEIANGHPLMPRVTGLGCTATAVTAAFCAVNAEPSQAATSAMAVMGIVGELAGERADGPGSLQLHFLDGLYQLGDAEISARARLRRAR